MKFSIEHGGDRIRAAVTQRIAWVDQRMSPKNIDKSSGGLYKENRDCVRPNPPLGVPRLNSRKRERATMPVRKSKFIQLHMFSHHSPSAIADPQKRGAKGYFSGSRLEFLGEYRDEYISLCHKSRAKFWHRFYKSWWETYPWCLPDNEEPPTGDAEKMKELSNVGADKKLKREVEDTLRAVGLLHFLVMRA